jgi:type IV secretion system T-DNA border endonuclease VirD1
MTYSEEPFLPDLAPMRSPRGSQRVEPDGYKIVSVRLREAEYETFSEQVRALGLTNNLALRVAARRIGGFLEIDRDTRKLLEGIVRAIGVISERIAELKVACALSGQVDTKEFAAQRAAFGREFAQLDAQLRTILNVSHRRLDGRLMLQEANNS